MKSTVALALGTLLLTVAGCDDAGEPVDGSSVDEFRSQDVCSKTQKTYGVSFAAKGIPWDDDIGPAPDWWFRNMEEQVVSNSAETLAGTVRYLDGGAEMCSRVCGEADRRWTGEGCVFSSDLQADISGEIETRYGVAPEYQIDGEVEVGCSCR